MAGSSCRAGSPPAGSARPRTPAGRGAASWRPPRWPAAAGRQSHDVPHLPDEQRHDEQQPATEPEVRRGVLRPQRQERSRAPPSRRTRGATARAACTKRAPGEAAVAAGGPGCDRAAREPRLRRFAEAGPRRDGEPVRAGRRERPRRHRRRGRTRRAQRIGQPGVVGLAQVALGVQPVHPLQRRADVAATGPARGDRRVGPACGGRRDGTGDAADLEGQHAVEDPGDHRPQTQRDDHDAQRHLRPAHGPQAEDELDHPDRGGQPPVGQRVPAADGRDDVEAAGHGQPGAGKDRQQQQRRDRARPAARHRR